MAYESSYQKHVGKYVRAHTQSGNIVGRLKSIDLEDHSFDLEEVLSIEPGERSPEIAITKSTFYFSNLSGMTEVSPKHYERMKQPGAATKYLDQYVSIEYDGQYKHGKIHKINMENMEILPFINIGMKNGKNITYLEKNKPLIIGSGMIKSITPLDEKTLMYMIERNNKEMKSAKKKKK
jgi:hypothetical protein